MTDWQPIVLALTRSPRALRSWRITLLVLVLVVGYLALTPKPPPGIDLGWDKLNHACAFAAMAASACFGQRSARGRPVAMLALLAYGGLIEIAQTFVPGRNGEWADLLADAVGIAVGTALAAGLIATAASGLTRRARSPGSPDSG
ncbi:MAG: VanZ family protein [Burkholderiaceae bacterium]